MSDTINGHTLWRSWGAVQKASAANAPGTFRYALKKSKRVLDPHWQDILDFIKDDLAEHAWTPQPNGLPAPGDPFWPRLDEVLAKDITVDLHRFSEEALSGVDGLSVADEEALDFLVLKPAKEDA
jgi:hypothetical protein